MREITYNYSWLRRAIVIDTNLLNVESKYKSRRLGKQPDKRRVESEDTEELRAIRKEIAREVIRDMLREMYDEDPTMDSDRSIPDLLRILANKYEEGER